MTELDFFPDRHRRSVRFGKTIPAQKPVSLSITFHLLLHQFNREFILFAF